MSAKYRIDQVVRSEPPEVDSSPTGSASARIEDLESRLAQIEPPPEWTPRVNRQTFRFKLAASLRGLKHAFRGDSSFFAHAYRGLLIAFAAALLGVGPLQWCMLALAAALVLIAELAQNAIATLVCSLGDPEAPGPNAAREIATAGVFIAVIVFASVSITVLTVRFSELLSGR